MPEDEGRIRGLWISEQELHQLKNDIQALKIGFELYRHVADDEAAAGEISEEIRSTLERMSQATRTPDENELRARTVMSNAVN